MKKMKDNKVIASIGKKIRIKTKPKKKTSRKPKLKISDIKRGEGAPVNHLIDRIKAREREYTFYCVVVSLVVILVIAYFIFSSVRTPRDYTAMEVGSFVVSFNTVDENLGNVVDLTPLNPMSDVEGSKSQAYEVEIENTTNERQGVEIRLLDDVALIQEDGCSEMQVPYQYIHYQVGDGEIKLLDATTTSPVIYEGSLSASEKAKLQIRIWVTNSLPNEYMNYHYHGNLLVKNVETAK